ncbi:hypothetical protein [Neolewinella sp.]|uniref:hypothetical protein n=1 Tax=Neolewinella sp. TaxID=2993543 RepID=UPI003B52FB75
MSRQCRYGRGKQLVAHRRGTAISVDNYSDWQIRRLNGGEYLRPRRSDDWWLQPDTLTFLHRYPQGMTTRAFELTHAPSGRRLLLTAQDLYFDAAAQFSDTAKGETSSWDFRRRLLRSLRSKVLVLGQLLTSGDYGQDGLNLLNPKEAAQLLPAVADTLLRRGRGYRAVLLKDLYPTDSPHTAALLRKPFTLLPTDPCMLLPLRWPDLEAYVADLSSKYRVRYRRARTKLAGIQRRSLPAREVTERLDRIYALYRITSQGAAVNLTALTPDYFRWLGQHATVHGYFDPAGELIGFTTALANGPAYQAHYLGLEESYKRSHHLYHNMLFDLLGDALAGDFTTLDYGRTALEIKSSVGAVPHSYATLLRLCSPLLNPLVPFFLPAVFTAPQWQQRHPFR